MTEKQQSSGNRGHREQNPKLVKLSEPKPPDTGKIIAYVGVALVMLVTIVVFSALN